jgi:TetR/AcrR family transcriptional repressor of nem operon
MMTIMNRTSFRESLMPKVSRQQTDLNRLAIEESSARLFREQGLRGVSVADLMAAAGMTHGGFYGHFESKDALAAVACAKAFEQSAARWRKRTEGQADKAAARAALAEGYLAAQSRAAVGSGCALAALAGDVAREPAGKPIHAAYQAGLDSLLDILQALQDTGDPALDRRLALAQLSTLVGAMVLARASRGNRVSDEILAAAKASLTPPAASPPARARTPRRRPSGT